MVEGNGPSPLLVHQLVLGLPDTSLTSALVAGGREFYGWGGDRHTLANIYDILSTLLIVTGQWKNKAPAIPPHPRPKKKKPAVKQTVKALYAKFTGGRTNGC